MKIKNAGWNFGGRRLEDDEMYPPDSDRRPLAVMTSRVLYPALPTVSTPIGTIESRVIGPRELAVFGKLNDDPAIF